MIITNLLESYERMFAFGQKHLNDLFVMDGIQSVSARDKILREIISNSLAHRDYSSGYVAKMVIEADRIEVENGNRAHGIGALSLETFQPFAKNPAISKVFREIGYADELGSGMRNSYKYTRQYSGAEPEFIEGDVFKIIIPLSVGAMTKVGPGAQVSGQQSAQVTIAPEVRAAIKLSDEKLEDLLVFCREPRSRAEIQERCGISSREYFRLNILKPLTNNGILSMLHPENPSHRAQKYFVPTQE